MAFKISIECLGLGWPARRGGEEEEEVEVGIMSFIRGYKGIMVQL